MDIQPFPGWRYAAEDITKLIAPPYDVLSGKEKEEFLSRDSHNIVDVDLPHVPPKELGPEEEYDQAAKTLDSWKNDGTLQQEDSPAIYVYEQTYSWAGKTYSRRGMIAGVRATKLGEDVIPHEHTFAGPKADRLRLTQKTETQLSPIFGLHEDPGGVVEKILEQKASEKPDQSATLRGVEEKIWAITDPETIEQIQSALAEVPVFIADGHHRYTTAMNYRDQLLEEGKIDKNHPANYVMFVLVARSNPGLLVLPTHRVISGLKDEFSVEKLVDSADAFDWEKIDISDVDLADATPFLAKHGKHAMGFVGKNTDEMWIAKLKDPQAMKDAAPDECDAWRELDVAILHELIMNRALEPWKTDQTEVDYTPDGNEMIESLKSGAQLGGCLQGTPVKDVERIALAGASMPHKSTYFYPKLATGMVLKPMS